MRFFRQIRIYMQRYLWCLLLVFLFSKNQENVIHNFNSIIAKEWLEKGPVCHQYIIEFHDGNRLIYTALVGYPNCDHCQFGLKASDVFEERYDATDEELDFIRQAYNARVNPQPIKRFNPLLLP